MVSINRKLTVAGASGLVLGVILWLIGVTTLSIIPTLPAQTPIATFIIGFGGAVSAVLAEDVKAKGTSINRKLVVAGSTGLTLGTTLWLIGAVVLTVIPTLNPLLPLATFIIGFGGAVSATLAEDTNTQTEETKQPTP